MDEIAEVLCHPNVFSFLHVPVQSGSDRVLSAMRREYTVGEFIRLADFLLDRVPGLCLATVRLGRYSPSRPPTLEWIAVQTISRPCSAVPPLSEPGLSLPSFLDLAGHHLRVPWGDGGGL